MRKKSGFVKLFGDYPMIKVMDFLITYREFDYPLTEIAENSGVAWSTIHTFFPQLLAMGLVKETRRIGRAKLYKLNGESKIAKELIALDNKLIKELAGELAGEKSHAGRKTTPKPR